MIATLAFRNLVHDRTRCAIVVTGLATSIALVSIQLGVLLGFDRMISSVLDHTRADLWIVPNGTTTFDDSASLDMDARYAALASADVVSIAPIIVGFAEWRRPAGGTTSVIVVGANPDDGVLRPWNMSSGHGLRLRTPNAVSVDTTYASVLGVAGIGTEAAIEGVKATVVAMSTGIRSFTTSPYVFTSLSQARDYLGTPSDRATYLALTLNNGADPRAVRRRLAARLRDVEVLLPGEFRQRNLEKWLLGTGAGAVLIGGSVLSLLVGGLIVAQTLYANINDRVREFATLKAIGSSRAYLKAVVLSQAGVSTAAGLLLAGLVVAGAAVSAAASPLPIVVTPALVAVVVTLAVLMGAGASMAAIRKVLRIDPALVFAR
jgi:putative ABC transport system permease protein